MGRPDRRSGLAVVIASMLALAACSSAATPAPTAAPTAKPAGSPTAAPSPTATALPGTKTFSVGAPAASVANVVFRAALYAMNTSGYTVTLTPVTTPELVVEGTSKNTFQFGDGSINSVMAAVEKGAALRVIVDRTGNEWSLYTKSDIADCKGLAGKQLAVTSLGSAVTAMLKAWMAKTCPGTTPNFLVIASSTDRAAALLANQIDASPLQLADGLPLVTNAASKDKFKILANFQRDLPEVLISSVYVNLDFARDNPGTVVAVVKAIITENRKSADDPTYLKKTVLQYIPAIDQSSLDAVVKAYQDFKLFDVNGGLTDAKLAYNAKFYGPAPDGAGSTKAVMAVNTFADLTYLNIALNELGKK